MKVNLYQIGLALFISSCCGAIGEEGADRYRIVSERMPAKAGDEVELLAESFQRLKIEGEVNDQDISKTKVMFSQLKARMRIVRWDATNEFGMAEFDVEHLIKGDEFSTNKLLAVGDKVVATYIGGEAFYKSPERILSSEIRYLMDQLSLKPIGIRSGKYLGGLAAGKEACKVGDCWDVPLAEFFDEVDKSKQKSVTNGIVGTRCFIGLTNIFNVKCFRLGSTVKVSQEVLGALPPSLLRKFLPTDVSEVVNAEGEVESEVAFPFDAALQPLVMTHATKVRGRFFRRGNFANVEGSGVARFVFKPISKSEKH